jgi:KDO2-lipid IV(A) lauroyltransferase
MAYRSGKLILAVTAHLGYWEIGLSSLADLGYPVTGVYSPFLDPRIDRWMKRNRDARVDWVAVGSGVVQRCLGALKAGRIVGMLGDVPFGEEGKLMKINGMSARIPVGPWIIAQRAHAMVFPCFILRQSPSRYRAIIHDAVVSKAGAGPEKMMAIYVSHLQFYLTHYPEQWGVLTPFWSDSNADS